MFKAHDLKLYWSFQFEQGKSRFEQFLLLKWLIISGFFDLQDMSSHALEGFLPFSPFHPNRSCSGLAQVLFWSSIGQFISGFDVLVLAAFLKPNQHQTTKPATTKEDQL